MAIALEKDYAPIVVEQEQEEETTPGLPFSFTGKATEYFGVWIVNIILSVITLGIYSAWAKVRNKRYFYGNTKLNGSSFSYLASPIQILKGRIIMFAFFAAYVLIGLFFPWIASAFLLFLYFLTPWLVVKALTFNARNSAYRNVRFGFTGQVGEAFKVYLLLPLGAFLTLGGLIPYNAYRANQFMANHSRYGQSKFQFEGAVGKYYKIYGIALMFFLSAFFVFSILTGITMGIISYLLGDSPDMIKDLIPDHLEPYIGTSEQLMPILILIPMAIIIFTGYTYITTRLQNYFFSNTKIGAHRLRLNLSFWRVLWIRLSNLAAIALTLGLMIPWAKVRMARYQIEAMSLIPHGDLDVAVSEEQARVSAMGEEFGEGMDLDLGLGV